MLAVLVLALVSSMHDRDRPILKDSTACLLLVAWELHVWTGLTSFQKMPQLVASLLLPTPSLPEDQLVFCYSGWRGQNLAGAEHC